ncbi:MAG: CotY/CotZ family spore coat protein [Bacilli bacterium]|nr:CotY/CotZ family spore coat protein [Bacilli bacterium]MDD4808687.1 CotY/CotZ family spore coat protein [Bacilli bacterium]
MCINEKKDCNCIAEILKVILILQQNACPDEACLETCDRGFLGCNVASVKCNTRPIMLFTSCGNGEPWSMPINKADDNCQNQGPKSCVFRIEKLDECCATFRVLAPNPDSCEATTRPYVETNSFFTMNLECVCSIRCLPDTYVDCV